jgi:hypothetical protein
MLRVDFALDLFTILLRGAVKILIFPSQDDEAHFCHQKMIRKNAYASQRQFKGYLDFKAPHIKPNDLDGTEGGQQQYFTLCRVNHCNESHHLSHVAPEHIDTAITQKHILFPINRAERYLHLLFLIKLKKSAQADLSAVFFGAPRPRFLALRTL